MTGRSPNPGPPVVYRVFAADGELLWVGFSQCIARRWAAHKRSPEYGHLASWFTTELVRDRRAGFAREREVIRAEKPRFNVLDHPAPTSVGALTDLDDPRHGKRGTYMYYHCRCDRCRAANTEWQQQRRAGLRKRRYDAEMAFIRYVDGKAA